MKDQLRENQQIGSQVVIDRLTDDQHIEGEQKLDWRLDMLIENQRIEGRRRDNISGSKISISELQQIWC